MALIQTRSDPDRRALARWVLACVECVLSLFDADAAAQDEIRWQVAHLSERERAALRLLPPPQGID